MSAHGLAAEQLTAIQGLLQHLNGTFDAHALDLACEVGFLGPGDTLVGRVEHNGSEYVFFPGASA